MSKSKDTGQTNRNRSLDYSALGYQSPFERLLSDISIELKTLQFRSRSKYRFRINLKLRTDLEQLFKHRKTREFLSILIAFFKYSTSIARAIIALLLVLFILSSKFLLRPYDVTTTSDMLFVCPFMQFQSAVSCICVLYQLGWSRF